MNVKELKDRAMGKIDSLRAFVDKYPQLDALNNHLSYNLSANPFDFLLDIIKHTAGYDAIIKWVGSTIAVGLPAIELTVKGVLLSNMSNLIQCSLDPRIPDRLLRDGLVFDLKELDIMNILEYSPLSSVTVSNTKVNAVAEDDKSSRSWYDKLVGKLPGRIKEVNPGKYYYFGCDYETVVRNGKNVRYPLLPDDLKDAADFNAFLWYVKNREPYRKAWRGTNFFRSQFDDSIYHKGFMQQREELVGEKKYNKKCLEERNNTAACKFKKEAGILTLEYRETSSGLHDALGNELSGLQTPHDNCLHVFIGNTEPLDDEGIVAKRNRYKNLSKIVEERKETINGLVKEIEGLEKDNEKNEKDLKEAKGKTVNEISDTIKLNKSQIKVKRKELKEREKELIQDKKDMETVRSGLSDASIYGRNYPALEQNYYYKRTLIEFNVDYISSLKLFDSKVVTAQVIDALTGCLSIDLNLSINELLVKNVVRQSIEKVIKDDSATVSDCFFAFSDDEYNRLLKKAELNYRGFYSADGETNGTAKIDALNILANMDSLNSNSSKREIQSTIERALTEIGYSLEKTTVMPDDSNGIVFGGDMYMNTNIQFNFIEKILNSLVYSIVNSLISPKVYLLLAVNLETLGQSSNLTILEILDHYTNMIIELINQIKDILLKSLLEWVAKEIKKLLDVVKEKLILERIQNYRELLNRCIAAYKLYSQMFKRKNQEWDVDNVDFADIENSAVDVVQEDNC